MAAEKTMTGFKQCFGLKQYIPERQPSADDSMRNSHKQQNVLEKCKTYQGRNREK